MRVAIFTLLLALLAGISKAQNCDIATTGVAIVNADNTAPISTICVGQQANFKFSIFNAGSSLTCVIPANSVQAVFDFPGGIQSHIYPHPNGYTFVSGFFSWTYNSGAKILIGTNILPIPNGQGDADVLIDVIGNAAGAASSNLNLTQGLGISDNAGNNFGGAQLTVRAIPVISVSAAPANDLCPNTNVNVTFNVTETAAIGGTFNWVAKDQLNNTLASANGVAYGAGAVNQNFNQPCNTTITFTFTPIGPGPNNCPGVAVTRVVNIRDLVAPVIGSLPAPSTIDCSATPSFTTPTVSDACDPNPSLTFINTTTAGSCAGNYILHRTWTATDNCGNSTSATQDITVTDTHGPVLSGVPANTAADCGSVPSAATVTATDDCSGVNGSVVLTETTTAGSCAGNYILHRTWTATDNCGNATSATQDITVTDTHGPVLSGVPANTAADCSSVPSAATVTATDDCSGVNGSVVLTETTTAGSCAGNYILHRTWTATDNCGNATSATQDITVTDTHGPVLSGVPANTAADCGSVPSAATVTATDDCSGVNGSVVLTETTTAGSCAGNYILHRTWTATDNCGNATSATQDITVTDTHGPVLSGVPANTAADCGSVPSAATVTATDDCSGVNGSVVLTETTTAGSCAGNYILHRTWTATDNCGNATSATQDITVTDTHGPVLSGVPANTAADCGSVPSAATVTATDDCSGVNGSVVLTETTTAGSCAGNYILHRTWTATDNCGNATSATQDITVTDTHGPVLSGVPANTAADCGSVPSAATVTATDDCSGVNGSVVLTETTTAGSCAGNYILHRTWTATDNCGNATSATQDITVTDTHGPVLSGVPANTAADCGSVPSAATVTATDDCSGVNGSVVLTETTTAGSCAGNYILHRTWTATDNCGNATSATQDITVTDTHGPVLSGVPANTAADCGSVPSAATVTATDDCSGVNGSVVLTETTTAGSCAGNYILHRTWTATDNCGNATSATQDITVTDTHGPVLSGVPANTAADCGSVPSAATVTATDDCSGVNGSVVLTETTTAGSCAGNYILHRTWTATDNCGNATSATQDITVTDTHGPVLSGVPANTAADCGSVPSAATVTATDDCSGVNGSVVLTETTTAGSCAGNYILHRTWTATDNCGNATSATQDITVTDTHGPVLSGVPANTAADCGSVPSAATVTATDDCSGVNGSVVLTETTTAGSCAGNYILHRTWTATDNCGNATSATQDITVTDTHGPVLSGVPANTAADCSSVPSAATVTATDDCSGVNGSVVLTETTTAGSCAGNYILHRTWTATDNCGNATSATQDITVTDTHGPVLSGVPANTAADCSSVPSAATVTATDDCSGVNGSVVLTETTTAGSCAGNYILRRTWTATDNCGNATSATQDITVTDTHGPVLSGVPANTAADCGSVPSAATVTATDDCSGVNGSVVLTETTTAGSCAGNYILHRTWTATDNCGNATSATQDITVTDTHGPVINNCPGNIVISTGPGSTSCDKIVTWTVPTATDDCSGVTSVNSNHNSGDLFPIGPTTVIYTFTDGCGNASICTFTVTVVDNTPPALVNCPSPIINASPNSAGCIYTTTLTDATFTDNCGVPTVTWSITGPGALPPLSGTSPIGSHSFGLGMSTITFTATDGAGNTNTCVVTISVLNSLAATISGTTTAVQGPTSSPITFSGSGGTTPYTFTYNVNGGSSQTVTTTGINTSVVVQQTNAAAGQFIYTLTNITDANGCTGTLPADNKDTVTVLVGRPDLFSAVSAPLNTQFINAQEKEGYVTISNAAVVTNPTTGTITFRISLVANFDLEVLGTTITSAAVSVNNTDWNVSLGPFGYTLTSKPGVVINGGFASSKIGFKLKAIGFSNSSGIMTVTIFNDTGGASPGTGDSNNTNNQSVKLFTIN